MSATLTVEGARASLAGEVEFEDVAALKAEGSRLCERAGEAVEFDLTGVTQANSVTVALMLAWTRSGAGEGVDVGFAGASEPLRKIVQFSGLAGLLTLH